MTEYQVGDVIELPPEPPVGSMVEGRDTAGLVRLVRRKDGWHVAGTTRAIPWPSVVKLWAPLTVVTLPYGPQEKP